MRGRCLLLLSWVAFAQTSNIEQLWKDAVQAHQQGQFEIALDKYGAILKVKPTFVPALSNTGTIYSRVGRFEDAAIQYRKALESGGNHPGIRLNLGIAYYNQSRLDEAVTEFEKLPALTEQFKLLLADCYLRTGQNQKVIALLKAQETAEDRAVSYPLGTALIRDSQIERGQRIVNRVFRDEMRKL